MNRMTRVLLIVGAWAVGYSVHAAPIKVFILAGQSNAGGGMHPVNNPPPAPLNAPQENLFNYKVQTSSLNESANWIDMQPLPGPTGWGTELSFTLAMQQRTGSPVALIKTSWNGSSLWRDWLPTGTGVNQLYPWMLSKVNASLDQLEAQGYPPQLSGFLWIHGEADAGTEANSLAYDDNLAILASHLRADLATPNLPFLLNQAHSDLARAYVTQLRQSQLNAASADSHMHVVNVDDLSLGGDNVHWTPGMHVELGRRFADVLMPSGDFDDNGTVDGADLPAWRSAVGVNRNGDGAADGVSDGHDFLLWQRQVGMPPVTVMAAAVPEPSSALLLAVLLLGAQLGGRVTDVVAT
jgi:hypothetical protein